MATPEGFTPLGQPMTPEQIEISKAIALRDALHEYGFVLNLVEGYRLRTGDNGEIYVGPSYAPMEIEEDAVDAAESYWELRHRQNLCDQEYIGPPDIR